MPFKTLDVDIVAVTEVWLRPEEVDHDSMASGHPFFGMDRADGRMGSGTLMLVAEKYEAYEGHKLHTPTYRS